MAYSESAALKALSEIRDPRTGRDIVASGMLADLIFKDGQLRAVLSIDPALANGFEPVRKSAEDTLAALEDVETASVILTAHKAAPQLGKSAAPKKRVVPHQARRPDGYQGDSQIETVLAVSSAKGGVGKSTMAVNLAVALAKLGKSVGLLDADIHGPSAPILLGLKNVMAKTEEYEGRRLIKPFTAHGIKAMSIGFLTEDNGPIIWRGPMVQGAISKMLWDVNWGKLDYLIIDMPPGTGDAQLGLAQDIKPQGAIIVSTPQDLALADARKGVKMFEKVDIPILGLIENMAVFICPDCGSAHHIFGKDGARAEAENMKVPYLGAAPLDMVIRESGDAGIPAAADDGKIADIFAEMAQAIIA
ncbi:Mrp/NBP35 family ATP-binding protein [Hellea balneolensis]|uniref:Mrp/NBP35 family ATP-binding protein n=1 Tax=Hellea balneolensis TaxID=287478 RepID=UPI0003F8D5FA|nr:Mrp/NBP35 family ATP-binding protein [Hellea balneolensis]